MNLLVVYCRKTMAAKMPKTRLKDDVAMEMAPLVGALPVPVAPWLPVPRGPVVAAPPPGVVGVTGVRTVELLMGVRMGVAVALKGVMGVIGVLIVELLKMVDMDVGVMMGVVPETGVEPTASDLTVN